MSTGNVAPANSGTNAAESTPVERRCENADCNASKLLSMVPKRKTQQFVTEPNVMEKPMLINGFTTVFQVDGSSAKLADLKNVPSVSTTNAKAIYRIVPNTHAHIVNYVVVDAEGESLRKINESDPATMRKLLESQKVSADQMLKKLIAGVSVTVGSNSVAGSAASVAGSNSARSSNSSAAPPLATLSHPQSIQSPVASAKVASTVAAGVAAVGAAPPQQAPPQMPPQMATQMAQIPPPQAPPQMPLKSGQIQLPVRMHPNLKITAVASADTVSAMNSVPPTASTVVQPSVPLITPVPLSALQSAPVLLPQGMRPGIASLSTPTLTSTPALDTVEKPVFDKMQAELQELRRTVAMLAEAQAKNQMPKPQPTSTAANIAPKPNISLATTLRNVKRLRQN